jgi:hypothetical protein
LLKEELETVAPLYIVHEHDAFSFDEFELEYDIREEKLVDFGAAVILEVMEGYSRAGNGLTYRTAY